MFLVLKGEMVKKGISVADLASKIGVAEKTLRNKINGETEFNWSEVCKIHKIVNSSMPKDELFEKQTNVR